MNKNIAFIYSRYFPFGGGVANAAKSLAEALAKEGNKVTFYTIHSGRSTLSSRQIIAGVHIDRIRIPSIVFKVLRVKSEEKKIKMIGTLIGLYILLTRRKHDIFIGHNLQWGGIIASIVGVINKIPSAAMTHGEDVNQLTGFPRKEMLTKFALKRLTYCFVLNTDFAKILQKYHDQIYFRLPNILNISQREILSETVIKKRHNRGNLKLLCIGRFERSNKGVEIKGFSTAIAAMELLPENFHLEIIGDGVARGDYEKLIKEKKLSGRVHLSGALEYSEAQRRMWNSSLLLMPSNLEGLGMVMLESMSKGIPVIATNIEGPKEYIKSGSNGFLIEPSDSAMMVEYIQCLSRSFQIYKKISLASKQTYSENFTEKIVVDNFYKYLGWV